MNPEREHADFVRRIQAIRRSSEIRRAKFERWAEERRRAEADAAEAIGKWTVERAARAVSELRRRNWLRGEPPRKRSQWSGAFCLLVSAADSALTTVPDSE